MLYGEHSGPFGRPECESWADRPLFAGDRALRRSSIAHRSRGSGGVAQPSQAVLELHRRGEVSSSAHLAIAAASAAP